MANNKDFKVKNGIKPTVYHEGVGTVTSGSVGYSLASASYDSKSFSVASELSGPFPQDGFIGSSDTKFYVIEATSTSVYQYTMSTANDITTASYDSKSFDFSSQEGSPRTIHIKDDGTKLYTVGTTNDTVYQYSLSTAWDVSTASYDSVSFSVSSQSTTPVGMFIGNSGSNLYIYDGTEVIYQYTLSTAWNVSSASYDSKSFSVSAQDTNGKGLWFKSDGTIMYTSGYTTGEFFEYSLTTAWDVSTASYVRTFDASAQGAVHSRPIFNSDGTKMYSVSNTNDVIYQYSTVLNTRTLDLSTGSVFEITPTSDIQISLSNPADSGTVSQATLLLDGGAAVTYDLANASYDSVSFSVSSQETSPAFVLFKTDGTKMYVGGSGNDTVYQYSLSTAWDTSTASYDSVSFSVASQENNLRGLYIKPDGLKFYTIGIQADVVHQYTMSTAWDMSTASYDSVSFSVTSQEGEPQGISFKTDGTKMFVVGSLGDEVNEYSLSTAWDISTASFTTNFVISGQDTNPNDIYFKDDGTKFWISGDTNNTVYQYSCSTVWDISTASYDSISFSVATQETGPQGLSFGNSGTKLYVVGTGNDTVFQYSTGSAATITYPSTVEWPSGTAPTSPAIGETDVLTFTTRNGGTSYQAVQAIDGAK